MDEDVAIERFVVCGLWLDGERHSERLWTVGARQGQERLDAEETGGSSVPLQMGGKSECSPDSDSSRGEGGS